MSSNTWSHRLRTQPDRARAPVVLVALAVGERRQEPEVELPRPAPQRRARPPRRRSLNRSRREVGPCCSMAPIGWTSTELGPRTSSPGRSGGRGGSASSGCARGLGCAGRGVGARGRPYQRNPHVSGLQARSWTGGQSFARPLGPASKISDKAGFGAYGSAPTPPHARSPPRHHPRPRPPRSRSLADDDAPPPRRPRRRWRGPLEVRTDPRTGLIVKVGESLPPIPASA